MYRIEHIVVPYPFFAVILQFCCFINGINNSFNIAFGIEISKRNTDTATVFCAQRFVSKRSAVIAGPDDNLITKRKGGLFA